LVAVAQQELAHQVEQAPIRHFQPSQQPVVAAVVTTRQAQQAVLAVVVAAAQTQLTAAQEQQIKVMPAVLTDHLQGMQEAAVVELPQSAATVH
jgi:hypothetical protein